MGVSSPHRNKDTNNLNSYFTDAVRKRTVHGSAPDLANVEPAVPDKAGKKHSDDETEKIISELPSWQDQLSTRGYIVGESRVICEPVQRHCREKPFSLTLEYM